ncbi:MULTISPECIES: substrate-binding domain-containing protein [unclassified Streptomyces]|uniref:substrate-binding domain-containing protein n=1 Tax=unclassified Streptomyces TaxID=2593676 RepID=UPI0033B6A21D
MPAPEPMPAVFTETMAKAEHDVDLHRALDDLGAVVPDDVALVGADNLPIATFLRPALSSLALNPMEIADRVCTAIRSMLERSAHTEPVVAGVLATPLLIRRKAS